MNSQENPLSIKKGPTIDKQIDTNDLIEFNPKFSLIREFRESNDQPYASVHAILLTDNGQIVLVKENGDEFYNLPGGGLKLGETPEEAIGRELNEELSVCPPLIFFGAISDNNGTNIGLYFGKIEQKRLAINTECPEEDQIVDIKLIPLADAFELIEKINPLVSDLLVKNSIFSPTH